MWRVSDGQLSQCLEGSGGALQWVAWHPRGEVLAAGTEDCMVYMWNAATGAVMQVGPGAAGEVEKALRRESGSAG